MLLPGTSSAGVADAVIKAELRDYAQRETNINIAAILGQRFLLIKNKLVTYDLFLSLAHSEGINRPRIRKIMYFLWCFRDPRVRRFICERIASSDGHWDINQLVNRANYDFFMQFCAKRTAIKSRSNIENFLFEIGIFDRRNQQIHLELDDGWLSDAMRVVAQHERAAAQRRAMVNDPIDFLIVSGWHGLANATKEELLDLTGSIITDTEPLEDEAIARPSASESRTWNRPAPQHSSRLSTSTIINLVAHERASSAHHQLEQLTDAAARSQGYTPLYNDQIDMHFSTPYGHVLAEMKSCHRGNLHSQVRRGVSQLLEYQFIYRERLGKDVVPILIIETQPTREHRWLIEYTESIGILLAWKDENRLVTTVNIPTALSGVVLPQ
jgi:hypothetical protein